MGTSGVCFVCSGRLRCGKALGLFLTSPTRGPVTVHVVWVERTGEFKAVVLLPSAF